MDLPIKKKLLAAASEINDIHIAGLQRELKKAIINGRGKLKGIDKLGGEKIFIFEFKGSAEILEMGVRKYLSPFSNKVITYIELNNGFPKMSISYDDKENEFMSIFLNFSRINQISEDEFDIPSDWQIVDITDKFI